MDRKEEVRREIWSLVLGSSCMSVILSFLTDLGVEDILTIWTLSVIGSLVIIRLTGQDSRDERRIDQLPR